MLEINQTYKMRIIALSIAFVGISLTSNYVLSNVATAQNISQSKTVSPNINQANSFIYDWFYRLDSQISETTLLTFLDPDNLLMQFPEMTVNNYDDFGKWYLGVQKAIKTNTHDVQQLEVTPRGNGLVD